MRGGERGGGGGGREGSEVTLPRGRATRTKRRKSDPWATSHLERSALNLAAPPNCDAAGAHAAVSERIGAGGHAGLR